MIKIDANMLKNEITKQNNFPGYTLCCQTIISILHPYLVNNKDFLTMVEKANTMLFWRKSLYYNEETQTLRFAFFVYVNIITKEFIVYQFSFENKSEALKLCAVFYMLFQNGKIDFKNGWSFLLTDDGIPYNISEFDYIFIENYINEIKMNLHAIFL